MGTQIAIPPETLAAFGGDELRARVFIEKYALHDADDRAVETLPEQMWDRVARELAGVEATPELHERWRREFRWLLDGFRFLPGGRIMYGAGNPRKLTLINCFVEALQHDSIEGIYTTAMHAARTYSRGGGIGIDVTPLRPAGAPVHNAARYSTGAVSFMELFSLTTGLIGQSGRRGALMLTIADRHPDVLEFCRVKRNLTSVRFANISVRLSDAFMRAVEQDGPWTLWFEGPETGRTERTIRARELWDELVIGARDWAEPGCLFWDTIKRMGTSEYNGMEVISTNPCLTGDARISTGRGLLRIDSLASSDAPLPDAALDTRVSPGIHAVPIARAWKTGTKPILRIETREGYTLRCTPDHRVLTARGWAPARALRPGDRLLVQNRKGGFGTLGSLELGRALGWLVGDGNVNAASGQAVLAFYGRKRAVAPILREAVAASIPRSARYPSPGVIAVPSHDRSEIHSARLLRALEELGFDPADKTKLPEGIWQGTEDMVRGFLQALFTADGTVLNASRARRSVRLASVSHRLLQDVQLLLANFGIPSRLYQDRRAAGTREMPDGRGGTRHYPTQAVHELAISRDGIALFAREIGFLPGSDKQEALEVLAASYTKGPYRNSYTARILSVTPDGVEDVYDLSVPVTHAFIANGITVHNCAEEPLGHGDCCDLGSINLERFVAHPFTPQARIDWGALARAAHAAVRFLDNVHEYSLARGLYPLPHQEAAARRGRRVGVGILGLGDMLVKLGLRYDSSDAIRTAGQVMEFIKLRAYEASADLAAEKGPFEAWDPDRHLAQEFYRAFPEPLLENIRASGLRNVSALTIPPVGSGAALAGVTNGLEPIFALSYVRRSESLSQEFFRVLHPLVRAYLERTGQEVSDAELGRARDPHACLKERLPEAFVVAHEIDPLKRVDMQAALQAHIDQSISSCLTADHLILTDRGLRYLNELAPAPQAPKTFTTVNGLCVATNNGLASADSFYHNGVAPTYTAVLDGHFEIRGTHHHRVLVLDPATYTLTWKPLGAIQPGDWVVMRKGLELWGNLYDWADIYGQPFRYDSPRAGSQHLNRISTPLRMSTDLARFLGYMNANGTILRNSVLFANEDDDVLEDFCRISESLFGTRPSLARDPRAKRLYSARIHSRKLVAFLRFLGLGGKKAEKRTPRCVLSSGREIAKEYIRGITLDGYVGSQHLVVLGNRSRWLIREAQQLLLNFGIDSNLTITSYDKTDFRRSTGRLYAHEPRPFYNLYVAGIDAKKFMELIGYAQQRKHAAAKDLFPSTRPSRKILGGFVPSSPTLSVALGTRMSTVRTNSLYTECHQLRSTLRVSISVHRERLAHTWESLSLNDIPGEIMDPTYLFKRVVSIDVSEPAPTFDLSVPGPHHYVANGIVCHNTVNLPREATAETVERVYFHAWRSGLKGISVYREGSREGVLLTPEEARRQHTLVALAETVRATALAAAPDLALDGGAPEEQIASAVRALADRLKGSPVQLHLAAPTEAEPLMRRPRALTGATYRVPTATGTMFVTINELDGQPVEVFCRLGKGGSHAEADSEMAGRLISVTLRLQTPVPRTERLRLIQEQLEGIGGGDPYGFGPNKVKSIADAIAKAIGWHLDAKGEGADPAPAQAGAAVPEAEPSTEPHGLPAPVTGGSNGNLCPQCHQYSLITDQGCTKCRQCSYKEC